MAGMSLCVMYENISKEAAKSMWRSFDDKVMELALPHRYSKDAAIVTITQWICIVMYQRKKTECGITYMWAG